jgi:hypothetical protein
MRGTLRVPSETLAQARVRSRSDSTSRADTVSHMSRKVTWTAVALLIAAVIATLVAIKFLEFVANQN